MELSLRSVIEGFVLACLVFVTQDYLRFRFRPPYLTREECRECHDACDALGKARDGYLNEFLSRVDARMSRMEDMMIAFITKPRV